MGFESVELVRRVYLAWQAGDLEELLSFVDPEVSWSPVLRFLEGERAAVGHRERRRWFRHIRIAYRSLRPLPEPSRITARQCWCGRLVGARRLEEGDLDVPVSWVWTVRPGRIVAIQAFLEEGAVRDVIAHGGVAECQRRCGRLRGTDARACRRSDRDPGRGRGPAARRRSQARRSRPWLRGGPTTSCEALGGERGQELFSNRHEMSSRTSAR